MENTIGFKACRMTIIFYIWLTAVINPLVVFAQQQVIPVHQHIEAPDVYDTGFARHVMRHEADGVKLWNRSLVEDDSPGAGTSNKGMFVEPVYGRRAIKKILEVKDNRCESARIIFYTLSTGSSETKALEVRVNGHKTTFTYRNRNQFGYVPIEPSWIKKGANEIILACPEAESPEEGYVIILARADEYEGRDRVANGQYGLQSVIGLHEENVQNTQERRVGSYSYISTDGGKSWSTKGKGLHSLSVAQYGIAHPPSDAGVNGEYCIRLNMEQYCAEGVLASEVIDLWEDTESPGILIPFTEVKALKMSLHGRAPENTNIEWQIRAGVTLDPLKEEDWTAWITVAEGTDAVAEPSGRWPLSATHWDTERAVTLPAVRYIQWRAVLSTRDPLVTPVVHSVDIGRDIFRKMTMPGNVIVTDVHNPSLTYSSTGFTYQEADRLWDTAVIDRDDLKAVVKDAKSEFDAIVKLLDFVSRRWVYGDPLVEYPRWNTIDMAERAHSMGNGGMCAQFAIYLAHVLTAMGYPARHVTVSGPGGHEVTEVWSNDYGKWIYLDPTQGADYYLYNTETGIPLSIYEMHNAYYKIWGITKPIDWMTPYSERLVLEKDYSKLPIDYSTTDPRLMLRDVNGVFRMAYDLAESIKIMPRNDYSHSLTPEPLQQGSMEWPWDGYINWYDELSPPKPQYSQYTDRVCDLWPTLNMVRFEAVPDIYCEKVFISMATFTPGFKTMQISVDGGDWKDSDEHFTWFLHSGKNKLEMRSVNGYGIAGPASVIACNYVIKHYPKASRTGSVD